MPHHIQSQYKWIRKLRNGLQQSSLSLHANSIEEIKKSHCRIWHSETSRGKCKNTSRYRHHQELSGKKYFNSTENDTEK